MPRAALWFASSLLCAVNFAFAAGNAASTLWYSQPAQKWTEALPIGNGRMGAMVFGGIFDERLQFNEDTLWRGSPHDYVREGAGAALPEIRRRIAEGNITNAVQLAREKFLSDPVRQKAYQPFGDLRFHFAGQGEVTNYRRELNLDTAIATTTFQLGDVKYQREVFASYPARAIILRITADKSAQISFTLQLDSPHTNSQTRAITPDSLALDGQVEDGGLKFESCVRVTTAGGSTSTNGNVLAVSNANSATIFLVAATSFKNFQDISADPAARCADDLQAVAKNDFPGLLAAHVADHQNLFRRTSLDLGHAAATDALPTDVRLQKIRTTGLQTDPALAALHFQFGRYLLIASSRPGSQPANLQGVWNEELNPPWESKWTININLEMNYWPAELANLSDCAAPLFALVDDLAVSGARTAQKQYGARGWVAHHNTDLWRGTAPINNIDGIWPTGGAWLCYHLWEHFLFTGDKEFLAHAYPVMKSASEFFMDSMVRDPNTGWLVTSPSFSPEQGSLCIGPTMDHQIIRALMDATLSAAKILDMDKAFTVQLAAVRQQVAPDQIGQHGQLQEWLQDLDRPNNNHRHLSPLFALYPGAEITPAQTNLFAAAKILLQWRGEGSTGWSYAWRIPLWARAGDGDFAFRQLSGLLQKRTLPNLFDLCGPFQIDGNFGATAGVVELLLQSHLTEIRNPKSEIRILDLLPALPKAWPAGAVKGLCARGGFEVDLAWTNSALIKVTLRSKLGQPCLIRHGGRSIEIKTEAGKECAFDGGLHPIK